MRSDRLGIDTISAGNRLVFAMECYKRGIVTKHNTGEAELTFGNHERTIAALKRIAYREGFCNILAEGVRKAAQSIGEGAERLTVKFVCLPAVGPILWDELAKLYSIVTGVDPGKKDLLIRAERIADLTKEFNLREGMSRKDYALPERFMKNPLEGQVIAKERFNGMLINIISSEDGARKKGRMFAKLGRPATRFFRKHLYFA